MLTRTFAYFTLFCYLVVGTLAVRFCLPETVSIDVSTSYLDMLADAPIKTSTEEVIVAAPEIKFEKIKIEAAPKIVHSVVNKPIIKVKPEVKEVRKAEEQMKDIVLAANELPFQETIVLKKIEFNNELPVNLVASYKDFTFTEAAVAATEVKDEVKTTLAASEDAEPEFFEYPVEENVAATTKEAAPVAAVKEEKIETPKVENKVVVTEASDEVENQNISDMMEPGVKEPQVAAAAPVEEPEFFDYPQTVTTQEVAKTEPATQVAPTNVVAADNPISFDYSKANTDLQKFVIPKVSKVNTHKGTGMQEANKGIDANAMKMADKHLQAEEKKPVRPTSYAATLLVNALGSDLKEMSKLQGFEVRFQDDLAASVEDYGSGEVRVENELSQPKMTRSITLLKRGYIPTSTEVILEEGATGVSIPMLEEEAFNTLQAQYEHGGVVGSLLVELDDETEVAKVDVGFGEVIKLDGDFKRTEKEDFRYQLFMGIRAGNTLLSYHRRNGEVVNKIVHVHEHEMTFDANFYEDVVNEKVRLYEEDLLAKENSPLIISGEQVRVFATEKTAKKINDHTYKLDFGSSHLGGRRYIELNHQDEPVFVGLRDNNNLAVPSENFMRFILSNVEGGKLGNRCLVQVNLDKKAESFEVAAESVGQSLMTYTQVLDKDGKFYDSLSDKTRKIIIVGEGQGARDVSADAKINVKIQYQDGSTQFLNSYCSPNTYLVEQL